MDATRTQAAAFFIQYLLLLLAALVWAQFAPVRDRIGGNITAFYWLIGAALAYLGVRSYLVLARRISNAWSDLWLSIDLLIISAAVRLTGGINSEAALAYFWPITIAATQRLPRRVAAVTAACGLLYVIATWHTRTDPKYPPSLIFRLVLLALLGVLAYYYALTERAKVEEMARLREQLALADYRSRLSREMHDGIQHYLADIAVRLELARQLMATDPREAARIALDQRFAVRQAAGELRYLVRLLRSPDVETQGFTTALQRHLALFSESTGISVPVEVEGEIRPLPPEVAHAAFRIVQEALMNAEKHARPSEVRVTMSFDASRFRCAVRDDGVGFEPSATPSEPSLTGGFGLASMRQRAQSVGGVVEMSSAPGRGTLIAFTAPLAGAA
ncbi:MAG: sensor histidine kinase [Armatimonadota bacterium]